MPESIPSRFGGRVGFPRKVVWKLVRPFVHSVATQTSALLSRQQEQIAEQREELTRQREELAASRIELDALRKEILATNHRVTWIEETGTVTPTKTSDVS